METEKNSSNMFRKFLESQGYGEGDVIRIVLTKEVKLERVTPTVELANALPYPIKGEGVCRICKRDYKIHVHLDYFIQPEHINTIRKFLTLLREKHDATQNMYLKLAVEAPDSVPNPKEMISLLVEKGEVNPQLANWLMRTFTHYIPSEQFRYKVDVGVSRKLTEIENHYEGLSRKWRTELRIHKRLYKQTNETEAYNNLIQIHEHNAETDYFNIQTDFHRVTSRILAYEKLMKQWEKALPPLKMAVMESMRKRKEKAVLPSLVIKPTRRTKKSEKR